MNARKGRPVYMDPDKPLIFHGGAYAAFHNAKNSFLNPGANTIKLSRQAETIKKDIETRPYYWVKLHDDDLGLTKDEYFEIAKFAIDLYPLTMNCVCDGKLTANQYYDVCAIMSKHGVFELVNCNKLAKACPEDVPDPLYKIMLDALINSVFSPTDYSEDTPTRIRSAMRQNGQLFQPNKKAALCFALWICMKPKYDKNDISYNDLATITKETVEVVKKVIIKNIYASPNSKFVDRLNVVSHWFDENNGMPQIVNDACGQIFDEIHKAGRERLEKKHERGSH